MIKAILAGKKTQTRRILKLRDSKVHEESKYLNGGSAQVALTGKTGGIVEFREQDGQWFGLSGYTTVCNIHCPYGVVGDQLWVRESTYKRPLPSFLTGEPTNAICGAYSADDEAVVEALGFDLAWWYSKDNCPSIHMPRYASRINLEVASVRIERLHAISEADAKAEGSPDYEEGIDAPPPDSDFEWSYRAAFCRLWTSINGADSWARNPWVWCISFRRIR